MSIEQALQHGLTPALLVPEYDTAYLDKYTRRFAQRGRTILDKAAVPAVLENFVESIRSEYPDVQQDEKPIVKVERGIVGLAVSWGFRKEAYSADGGTGIMCHNLLKVVARVGSQEVAFSQAGGWEVLPKSRWSFLREVEEAVVRAYRNPYVMIGSKGGFV